MSFLAQSGRCLSFYAIWDTSADRRAPDVKCMFDKGHHGNHEGQNTLGKLHVAWNDPEARLQLWRVETLQNEKEYKEEQGLSLHLHSGVPPIGWRVWGISKHDGRFILTSVSASFTWFGPVATTAKGADNKPMKVRGTDPVRRMAATDPGIYSYKTPELLRLHHGFDGRYAAGRIDIRGHVREHEMGWRSQKAVIRELWVWPTMSDGYFTFNLVGGKPEQIVKDLEDRYQCPVTSMKHNVEASAPGWAKYYTQWTEDYYRGEHRS